MQKYADLIQSLHEIDTNTMIEAAASVVPFFYRHCAWTHPELDHGKAILHSEVALNCYLAAYGVMHAVKMINVLGQLPTAAVSGNFEIVDWGCGQGLATMCLLDVLETSCLGAFPQKITLLDASAAALSRAQLNVTLKVGGKVDVHCVNTMLDRNSMDVKNTTFSKHVTIHLLSNIIDVRGIDTSLIAGIIASSSTESYVVCSGHAYTAGDVDWFSRKLVKHGASEIYKYNEPNAWELPNGKRYGGDLRIFHCAA